MQSLFERPCLSELLVDETGGMYAEAYGRSLIYRATLGVFAHRCHKKEPLLEKDIFSLGVVFFQLLTARVPSPGPDPVAGIFQARWGSDESLDSTRLNYRMGYYYVLVQHGGLHYNVVYSIILYHILPWSQDPMRESCRDPRRCRQLGEFPALFLAYSHQSSCAAQAPSSRIRRPPSTMQVKACYKRNHAGIGQDLVGFWD